MTYKEKDNGKLLNELSENNSDNNDACLFIRGEKDSQTQLLNKTAVITKVEKYLDESLSKNLNVNHSFLLIDIDNLNKVNECHGHIYGDIVLETFAGYLSGMFDQKDIIGRIDGDSFVVLQKETKGQQDIAQMSEAICRLARGKLPGLKEDGQITVSIGAAVFPGDGTNYDELFHKADIALYEAKNKGKDRYIIYNAGLDPSIYKGEIQQKRSKKKRKNRIMMIFWVPKNGY